MEWLVYILLVVAAFTVGCLTVRILDSKDDGVVIINEEKVEVIFRDPYEKLVKKRYVNLKIES